MNWLLTACAALALSATQNHRGGRKPTYVWWEGESPEATNFSSRSWLRADRLPNREGLSGGDWLSNTGKRTGDELFARYRISVPRTGTYHLWARKFWRHGPFRWRFDGGNWRVCGRDIALADNFTLRTNVCANWVHLGKVHLSAGPHRFELRLLAGRGQPAIACFDAFLLIQGQFLPRGRFKPDQRAGTAEPGWWPFEPQVDPFSPTPLDLRDLNEETTGQRGFITRKDDQLLRADGTPIRFWGVNLGPQVLLLDRDSLEYLARRLAKVGVNLVRFHGPVFSRRARDLAAVDPRLLDHLHLLAAALKRQGIYLELSFYFPLWLNIKPTHGITGYESIKNKHPFALIFFNRRLQSIHRRWARTLLRTKNPYTGRALADDPVLAVVELVNEDSLLFWTFNRRNIPPQQWNRLEGLFGRWVEGRYGCIPRAYQAWGAGSEERGDRPTEGRLALAEVWRLTSRGLPPPGPLRNRLSDQLRFLVQQQRDFYREMVRFLREEVGVKSLIVCSNWKTADPVLLGALERYTYTTGDIIDRHGYFGGPHRGRRAHYAVSVGDHYRDRSALLTPRPLPFMARQVLGFPHLVSEVGWTNPNRYKAECPLLCATYGALTGLDGMCFFALHGPGWEHSAQKFPLAVPSLMGQFPAAALIYRRGDVEQAEEVFRERLDLANLYRFKGWAEVRPPEGGGAPSGSIDPLAFYVGRVTWGINPPSTPLMKDLSPFIDRRRGVVRSATGQVVWDFGRGLLTVNTPRTQAAAGFLSRAGRLRLADISISSRNEFGAVIVTSLDGLPLARSQRILIQAMTEEKPYRWAARNGLISNLGEYPMTVRNIETTVEFEREGLEVIKDLDANGYPRRRRPIERTRNRNPLVRLVPDGLYTVVE